MYTYVYIVNGSSLEMMESVVIDRGRAVRGPPEGEAGRRRQGVPAAMGLRGRCSPRSTTYPPGGGRG